MRKLTNAACLYGLWLLLPFSFAYAQEASKLVWSDEFDYEGLPDTSRWNYDVGGHGFGNHEKQYYTAQDPDNAIVKGGYLIITARKENYQDNQYTSAKLTTQGKGDWQYGRVEVKAKLPSGRGTWPAIWMLPNVEPLQWPADGEIDIMEEVGYDPNNIHGTIHTEAYNHTKDTQRGKQILIKDAQQAFHVYAIEWTPEEIAWFIDDKKYHTFANEHTGKHTWPFDKPFYLILNIAVGGDWGGAQGIDDSIWPQSMEVDYVRVFQQEE